MGDRSGFVAGLFLGALIGVGLGILLAPRSGQDMREQLKGKAQDVTERLKSTASEMSGRMREGADDVTTKLRETLERKDDILNRLGRDG